MRCTLLFVCLAAPSFAGVKLVWERNAADKPPVPVTMVCEGQNGRMETGGERVLTLIWDGEKKLLTMLNPTDKTYMQMDPARIAATRGAPPAPAEPTFTAKGKKAHIGKWDCELYDVKRGEAQSEVCVVPWAKAPLKKDDLRCMKAITDAFRSMGARETDGAQGELDKLPGLPVQTSSDVNGRKTVTTLKSAERATAAADAFTIPSGFTVAKGRPQ